MSKGYYKTVRVQLSITSHIELLFSFQENFDVVNNYVSPLQKKKKKEKGKRLL